MTAYLLDVNLLLALVDPMHVHHEPAHRWFAHTGRQSWVTCPITENGFVRIASHPRYPNRPGDIAAVLAILRQFCALEGHQFWAAEASIGEMLPPDAIVSHQHITDIYLLGLAIHKEGKLATLDQRIPARLLVKGVEALEVISV